METAWAGSIEMATNVSSTDRRSWDKVNSD